MTPARDNGKWLAEMLERKPRAVCRLCSIKRGCEPDSLSQKNLLGADCSAHPNCCNSELVAQVYSCLLQVHLPRAAKGTFETQICRAALATPLCLSAPVSSENNDQIKWGAVETMLYLKQDRAQGKSCIHPSEYRSPCYYYGCGCCS